MASTSVIRTTPSDTDGCVNRSMPPSQCAQVGLAHGKLHLQSGRLRYADPRDLPSYPSAGLKKDDAAASAAASLGWAKRRTCEQGKADSSVSAFLMAALANKSKMAEEPLGASERSDAGFKAAALAAGSVQRQHQPKSDLPPSAWGNSAANLAFQASSGAATSAALSTSATSQPSRLHFHGTKTKTSSSSRTATPGTASDTTHARGGSMHAAKGAMAGLRARARSSSSPQQGVSPEAELYPDQARAASNALSAATVAHRPTLRPPNVQLANVGAVPITTMARAMYTSTPPVQPEVDEQRRIDVLHASAVAMAKRMYTQQQRIIDTVKYTQHARSSSSFRRDGEVAPDEEAVAAMRFDTLQEAAYRLAQERLAKLHEEHQMNRKFQDYYGSSVGVSMRRSTFGTIQRKLTRRRSASDGDLFAPAAAADDAKASQRIRQQMSLFHTKLSQFDEQKRARDREALLAAAQRNVKAQLQGIDQRVFEDTGRVAPSVQGSWEPKAQKAALLRVAASRDPNKGKIDIGGGKFMDTKAIDRIAAKKVQPLLDEINEKAEVERERQIALRMDEERRKSEVETEKQRQKEVAELHKKIRDENKEKEKVRREELKKEERARKEQEKMTRANTERASPGEHDAGSAEESNVSAKPVPTETLEPKLKRMSLPFLKTKPKENKDKAKETTDEDVNMMTPSTATPAEPSSASPPSSRKMKTWIKKRLSRPRAKSSGAETEPYGNEKNGDGSGSFVGGVTLARLQQGAENNSTPSMGKHSASTREVAMADVALHTDPAGDAGDEAGVSSLEDASRGPDADDAASEMAPSIVRSVSSDSSEDKFYDAKRGSRFTEMME